MAKKQFPLKEVSIEELFFSSEKYTYEIPIYQRNYAWEKDEIAALIGDVYDEFQKGNGKPYYIGTLVSYPKGENVYEVIDGQQRLTTIRLILGALDIDPTNHLTYRARKKSDATIKAIPNFDIDEYDEIDKGIENGFKCAKTALNELGVLKDAQFIKYFKERVHIVHYKVPKDIDLNHYFEIMNSRGEQLEKHEIEKASLMQKLDTDDERKVFNIIWEACANMNIYIQQSIDGIAAEDIFGNDLHTFNVGCFNDVMQLYLKARGDKNDAVRTISINEIIAPSGGDGWKELKEDVEKKDSFQPIIDFPNFLLIVLKIVRMNEDRFVPASFNLDDKELLNEFKTANMDAETVRKFAFILLKAKYLLDNYIVHHSKEDDTIDSNPWKLQVLHKEGKNRYLKNLNEGETQDVLAQLLSMFEVSLVRTVNDFVEIYGDGTVSSKGIPLFIFNYLDYLLWRVYNKRLQGKKTKETDPERREFFGMLGCNDFGLKVFEQFYFSRTRRSLEHYYPQKNATGEDGALTQDQINCFGNYAMIGSEANSSGSNWSPKTKLDHYLDSSVKINRISVASLKFWIMMQVCKDKGDWEFEEIEEHQKKMLQMLMGSF